MSENELSRQLLEGLRQLKMNIDLLHGIHKAKNLDLNSPYTKNTEDVMKIEYVNQALKGLGYLTDD